MAVVVLAASSALGQHTGAVAHAPAELVRFVLTSFTITPGSITNGGVAKGHAIISVPAGSQVVYVSLTQLSGGFAGVPPTVGIFNGNSVDFDLTTSLVTVATNASISATYGGVTKTATLQVLPAKITGFNPTKTNLVGGTSTPASLTLDGGVPAGAMVKIVSQIPALVWADGPVQVNNSDHTGFVMLNTAAVPHPMMVKVTASYAGSSRPVTLTLNPH